MRRLIVGYDRPFTEQFFRRHFRTFADRLEFSFITPEEVEYLAGWFAMFACVPLGNNIAHPRPIKELFALAYDSGRTNDRSTLQSAEAAANQIMFIEGFYALGGLWHNMRSGPSAYENPRLELMQTLYRNSTGGRLRTEKENYLLRQLSRTAPIWLSLLRLVPGNDYLEMLAARPSNYIVLPND